jgi:hypothetical protein
MGWLFSGNTSITWTGDSDFASVPSTIRSAASRPRQTRAGRTFRLSHMRGDSVPNAEIGERRLAVLAGGHAVYQSHGELTVGPEW